MVASNKIIKISVLFLSVSLIGGTVWYRHRTGEKNGKLFTVEKPVKKDLVQYVTATGTLKAKDEITVGSLVAGRVIELRVDDNDVVKKGQVLAVLDDGVGDSEVKRLTPLLKQARAKYEYQHKFYKRQKALFENGHISQDSFDLIVRDLINTREEIGQAQYALEKAQKAYDLLFVRTPEDGVVTARKVNLGQSVTAALQATELFTIARDLKQIEVDINVDEADIGLIKPGQQAYFTVDAFPRKRFEGTVSLIKYFAQTVENVVTYPTVLYVSNPDLSLRPQMTTNAEVKVVEAPNALCVHNKALRVNKAALETIAKKLSYKFEPLPPTSHKREDDNVWVFQNNTFKQVKVERGATQRTLTQIVSGITHTDMIVTDVSEPAQNNQFLKQMVGGSTIGRS